MINITRSQFLRSLSYLALEHEAIPDVIEVGKKSRLARDTRDFYAWMDSLEGNDNERLLEVATQVALRMFSKQKIDELLATYFRVSYMVGAGLVEFLPE